MEALAVLLAPGEMTEPHGVAADDRSKCSRPESDGPRDGPPLANEGALSGPPPTARAAAADDPAEIRPATIWSFVLPLEIGGMTGGVVYGAGIGMLGGGQASESELAPAGFEPLFSPLHWSQDTPS